MSAPQRHSLFNVFPSTAIIAMKLTQHHKPYSTGLLHLNLTRLLVLLAGISSTVTYASSDDAWKAFGKDVEKACKTATNSSIKNAKVTVDPFGSESYGLAIVHGQSVHNKKTKLNIICVYDKKNKTVEIGSELTTP